MMSELRSTQINAGHGKRAWDGEQRTHPDDIRPKQWSRRENTTRFSQGKDILMRATSFDTILDRVAFLLAQAWHCDAEAATRLRLWHRHMLLLAVVLDRRSIAALLDAAARVLENMTRRLDLGQEPEDDGYGDDFKESDTNIIKRQLLRELEQSSLIFGASTCKHFSNLASPATYAHLC
jgi:hypothetical protein